MEDTQAYGIRVEDKGADRVRVRFVDCTVRMAARNRNYLGAWAPIWLNSLEPEKVKRLGGVDFVNCSVEDDRDRPAIELTETRPGSGLYDVTGNIKVSGPSRTRAKLGDRLTGVTLRVEP